MPSDVRIFDQPFGDHALRVQRIVPDDSAVSSRPVLVFLHESLGCITVWRDFPVRLAEALGCTALVYDRRGYGASSPFPPEPRTPDYLEQEALVLDRLLDSLGVARAVLFGHSDGGSIALAAAARHPDRIQAVITEAAHVFVEDVTLEGIRGARELLRTTNMRERLYRHHGERTDGVTSAWIDTWLSPAFRDWTIEHLLTDVRCPVLVLQGAEDQYGTADQVRAIAEGVTGEARAFLFPGAGHSPHRDAADAVIAATQAFLADRGVLAPEG